MRLHKLISEHESSKRSKVDDISFIIPDQPFKMFGIEFESIEQCLAYCDANDIPYTKEKGAFGFDTYEFSTANN